MVVVVTLHGSCGERVVVVVKTHESCGDSEVSHFFDKPYYNESDVQNYKSQICLYPHSLSLNVPNQIAICFQAIKYF